MRSGKKVDMTQGSIMKLVLLFAIPICIGNVLQQLYNTVDTLIVGNFCDSIALAAVGTSSQPVEMLLCIFIGIGNGVSIIVSQCAGGGNTMKMKQVVSTATTFLYMCAVPVTILGLLLGPLVLKIMQVPADTWDMAVSYLRIIFLGTIGNMGYNMNAGILRGLGDSKASLLFLIISCGINIGLDLLFIAVFEMGVSGAALATIIAILSSWIFSIVYIRRQYPELEFSLLPKPIDKEILHGIIRIGVPLGLNNSIYSVGHIVLQSLVNAQGSTFMAACSVASKVTGIANVAIYSLSSSATTFAGQNLGAGNYARLKKGALRIPLFSGILTCTAGLIVTYYCRPLLALFNSDPGVLELGELYIRVVLPFSWTYAVFNGILSFVNGLGEVRYPTIANLLMLWAVRIPVGYIIAWFIDGKYVMAAYPISFTCGMIAMFAYFGTKQWREIRLKAIEQEKMLS